MTRALRPPRWSVGSAYYDARAKTARDVWTNLGEVSGEREFLTPDAALPFAREWARKLRADESVRAVVVRTTVRWLLVFGECWGVRPDGKLEGGAW